MAREGEYAGVGSQMLAAAHGYSELLTPRPAGQSCVGAPRARHVLSFNSCEQQGTETLHQCIAMESNRRTGSNPGGSIATFANGWNRRLPEAPDVSAGLPLSAVSRPPGHGHRTAEFRPTGNLQVRRSLSRSRPALLVPESIRER
jgi:hypothetical protein